MPADAEFSAFNHEAVTVSTAAVAITASVTSGGATKRGHRVLVTVEDQPVRFRYDGSDPTSTTGHKAAANDQLEFISYDDINRLRFIRDTTATGDATLRCTLECF